MLQAAGELLEDEGLFEEEEDDETGALAMCVVVSINAWGWFANKLFFEQW